jgi:hypothetical protein
LKSTFWPIVTERLLTPTRMSSNSRIVPKVIFGSAVAGWSAFGPGGTPTP